MVEGGDGVIAMQDEVRTEGIEIRNFGMRFQAAAEFIGDVTGEASLKWRQAGDVGLAVLRDHAADQFERRLLLLHTVEKGAAQSDFQGLRRVAGEEGIAAQMFRAHDAFEQRDVRLAFQPQGQARRLEADDFGYMRCNHGHADIELEGPRPKVYF